MSFLTEATVRRLSLTSASRIVMVQAPRQQFSTSVVWQKSVTESAKETIKNVDRKVSDKLIDGINVGCKC
ncbi:hypothetical protein F5X99DRAFT_397471 [Biscogniauxia marginata]|nr:hypothetical protein F5X99DRAFT_397471 [Biscogniauxia marginata]